ncbi:hypothetical protein SBA7_1650009 [Candidatus Sulfotelmatobacter sp. SbA7]|nr:hypothetical protein SBA7_1650009 [Candidatus Sulfotelmatobacter sp. SbA7]
MASALVKFSWLLGRLVPTYIVLYCPSARAYTTSDLRLADLPLAFLAFVGMTGHLPYVVKHVWKWKFPWPSRDDPKASS